MKDIDYDNAILLGNKLDGTVMRVKKTTDVIIFPVVKGDIIPFFFDEIPYEPGVRKLEYKRRTGTRIFYCP